MKQLTPNGRRPRVRRLAQAVAAVGLAAGGIGVLASTASADETCGSTKPGYNECFSVTALGNNVYSIHIGIDVFMSTQDAQAIMDGSPGTPFYAKVMGDDPSYDNFLFYVPVTWSAAGPGALSAEFDTVVAGTALDEDWGGDEVFARVGLTDPRSGSTRFMDSHVIHGDF